MIYEKKVHDIVQDLHKSDEKKGPLSLLENTKRSKRKIDLSKLDHHIGLESGVMSLTIG